MIKNDQNDHGVLEFTSYLYQITASEMNERIGRVLEFDFPVQYKGSSTEAFKQEGAVIDQLCWPTSCDALF